MYSALVRPCCNSEARTQTQTQQDFMTELSAHVIIIIIIATSFPLEKLWCVKKINVYVFDFVKHQPVSSCKSCNNGNVDNEMGHDTCISCAI